MAHVTLPPVLPGETIDIVMQVLPLLPLLLPPPPLTTISDRRRWIHCRVVQGFCSCHHGNEMALDKDAS
jgi:hypothetical protein